MIGVARIVGVVLAALFVALVGLPALLGWVAVPAGEGDAGPPAGSLVVLEPGARDVAVADVVAVAPGPGRVVLRQVQSIEGSTVTTVGPHGVPTQVDQGEIGAVAMYHVPVVGHVVAAIPVAQRPWWARAGAVAFLAWAAAELWSTRRPRDAEVVEDEPARPRRVGPTLPSASRRHALSARSSRLEASAEGADRETETTTAHPTPTSSGGAYPTRRSRARARRGPFDAVTGLLAGAVGAVVLAARSVDRRSDATDASEVSGERGGRHRAAGPASSVEPSAEDRRSSRARRARRSERSERLERPEQAASPEPAPAPETSWHQRPSTQEVAAAARVQDFEARRAAATAAFTHDVPLPRQAPPTPRPRAASPGVTPSAADSPAPPSAGMSPAERLLAQVEAKSKQIEGRGSQRRTENPRQTGEDRPD
ncbi:MAG: hypothetical protein Q4G43_08405 [Mobilicoccus sp.]|nr:hypothetical protein [Mobilicoccus sp.]